jgi:hypothetical protein
LLAVTLRPSANSLPIPRFSDAKGSVGQEFEGDPIRDTAIVFAPRHLVGVLIEVFAADPMMDAVLSTAEPTEIALRLIPSSVTYS